MYFDIYIFITFRSNIDQNEVALTYKSTATRATTYNMPLLTTVNHKGKNMSRTLTVVTPDVTVWSDLT